MCETKKSSQFEYLVFNPRPRAESQAERNRLQGVAESILKEDLKNGVASSSEEECDNDEFSPPPPEATSRKGLSTVLEGIRLPKNPLSDIGDPSENSLLRITNSPNVGALTEVSLI